jgi:hypothetical protein
MKKIIIVVLISIGYLTTGFNAQAQKGKYAKPAGSGIKASQPYVGNAPIVAAFNNTPVQDKNLAQFTGTIKIDSDSLFVFENNNLNKTTFYTYMVYLKMIRAGEDKNGIKLVEYDFFETLTSAWYKNVVVTKVNERQYNYTIYNVPLNTGVVIGFHYIDPTRNGDFNGGPICKMRITNAFSDEQIYRGKGTINASPNYQATTAGQVLTLPTITISNPVVQVQVVN